MEGFAVDEKASHAFFGIRFVGESREKHREVAMVLRAPFDGKAIGETEAVAHFSTKKALGLQQGLADLQRDPTDGSYLMLTSYEGPDENSRENLGGALFRIPAEWIEGDPPSRARELPKPLATFEGAKPEGVTVVPGGDIVIAFDDDRSKGLWSGYPNRSGQYTVLAADGTSKI
jgi:hypothetical protein